MKLWNAMAIIRAELGGVRDLICGRLKNVCPRNKKDSERRGLSLNGQLHFSVRFIYKN
jgi:hypothetical protein